MAIFPKGDPRRKAGRPPKNQDRTLREKLKAKALLNKRPPGRPTLYNAKLASKICSVVSTTNKSLRSLSQNYEWFPNDTTIYSWLSKYPEFLASYRQATLDRSMIWADELVEIADTPKMGQIRTVSGTDEAGNPIVKETRVIDMLEHRKLQIQARQWLLARLRPREYGDRIQVDNPNNPLDRLIESLDKRNEILSKQSDPDAGT